jgi:hypothetical protein
LLRHDAAIILTPTGEAIMAAATLKPGGKKFVVIREGEYRQLKAKATATRKAKAPKAKRRLTKQDRGDIAEAMRRLSEPGGTAADEVFRKLGV